MSVRGYQRAFIAREQNTQMKRELFEWTCTQCRAILVSEYAYRPNGWFVVDNYDVCSTACGHSLLDNIAESRAKSIEIAKDKKPQQEIKRALDLH
jgi:hypothetical protein